MKKVLIAVLILLIATALFLLKSTNKSKDRLEWSELSSKGMIWYDAVDYCKNLKEGGHSDWRLPNIDELRTLVQNNPNTVSGGKCEISEKDGNLDKDKNCGPGETGNNFSKLGDTKTLWSMSKSKEIWQMSWVIDFSNGFIFVEHITENKYSVRCVRQEEHDMCETARNYERFYYWNFYFSKFPKGECAEEAKAFIEKEDKEVCEEARKENTRASWEPYLKIFPKGKCSEEGNAVRNKYKKIDGLEWSDISDKILNHDDAIDYCNNLKEDGHSDWRLPDIDELRTLVQNHPDTVTGGKCNISENENIYIANMSSRCDGIEGKDFSKIGDTKLLLSSTYAYISYDNPGLSEYNQWGIDFSSGEIVPLLPGLYYFRCVR